MTEEVSILVAPQIMHDELEQSVPDFFAALQDSVSLVQPFIAYVHGMAKHPRGVSSLVNQATNDFADLCFDCAHSRGRAALRESRSLFELLVTLKDILASTDLAERYDRHRFVAAQMEADMIFEADALRKKERRADLHRRKKLKRDTAAGFDAAIKDYTSAYKRNWAAPRNLKDRTLIHGLDRDYNFYALASLVLHGTSGGELGLRATIADQTVHRQGPALSLCPLAFLQGLKYIDQIVKSCGNKRGGPTVAPLRAALRGCRELWPRYREAIMRLDRDTWPATPPLSVELVSIIWPDFTSVSWVIHDAQEQQVCEAEEPRLDDRRQTILDSIIVFLRDEGYPPSIITIAWPGVPTRISPGADWQPAPAEMPQVRHFSVGADERVFQHLPLPGGDE